MLQRLLLATLMCVSLSMQAGRLSRITKKVGHPLQKAIVVLACSAAACLMGLKAEAQLQLIPMDSYYWTRMKELSLGVGSHPGHGFVDGTMILVDNGSSDDHETSVGYLHGLATLDGDGMRLQELNTYIFYNYMLPYGTTYAETHNLMLEFTKLGFDHYDMRSFDLADDTDGFAVSHLHGIGLVLPLLATKVGVGSLDLVKTGLFKQADLEAWAGNEADFSYLLFLANSIWLHFRPMQDGIDFGPLDFNFKVEQMRTFRGDIDFADGTDGDFTAIWESAQAEVEVTLLDYNNSDDILKLGVDLTVFRQRLDANANAGKRFSQRKNGKQIRFKLSKYWE